MGKNHFILIMAGENEVKIDWRGLKSYIEQYAAVIASFSESNDPDSRASLEFKLVAKLMTAAWETGSKGIEPF